MRKANELFGKPIIEQATGQKLGSIQDIILDQDVRHIVAVLLDTGGWFHSARAVRWSNIVSVGDVVVVRGPESMITVDSDSELARLTENPQRLTGTTMISEGGERVGKVGDLFVNDQGEIVGYEIKQGFISDLRGRKFLPVDAVQAVGSDAVIASDRSLTTVKAEQQARDGTDQQAQEVPDATRT